MTYSELILSHGPSNYWKLNESSGLTAADSAGSAPGTISAGVTLGQPGPLADGTTAMSFPAAGAYIRVPLGYLAIGTAPVSIECWLSAVQTVGAGESKFILDTGGGANGVGVGILRGTSTAIFRIANGAGSVNAAASMPFDGTWHHVVAMLTRGGADALTIYVDGVQGGTTASPVPGLDLTSTLPLLVSTYSGGEADPDFRYNGLIDEIALYPRLLTPTEIADHYAARLVTTVPSAGCDHTTVWSRHLATLAPPTVESERAYLATLYGEPGGTDVSTLVSRWLQEISCGATSLEAALTPEPVQTGTASAAAADTLTLTFPGATGNGRGIVVGVISSSSSALPAGACSDNKGNTYTRILSQAGTGSSLAVYLCPKGVGGPVHTVTLAPALGPIEMLATAIEVRGVGAGLALDVSGSTTGTSSTPAISSGAVTTTGILGLALAGLDAAQSSLVVSTTDGQTGWSELAEDLA